MSEALDPARHVSVSASAGTGKTWLLTARIARLLLQGQRPEGILALTFTRKAAGEMRERVGARLRALALADDATLAGLLAEIGLQPTPEITRRARRLYEELLLGPWPLRAMTLHAFCQDLVSRFALQCGVTPNAELVENESELLAAAWQALQQHLLTQPQSAEARALERLIAMGYGEAQLRGMVVGFLDHRNDWRAFTAAAGDGLQHLEKRLRLQLRLGADATRASLDTPALGAHLQEFARGLETLGNTRSLKAERFVAVLAVNGPARLEALGSALLTQKGEPYAMSFAQAKQRAHGSLIDRMELLRTALIEVLMAAREQALREATFERTLAACTLGAAALRAMEAELRRRGALPFAELEWHACRLLADPQTAGWVQYKLDQRVDHLLVDEFQDTSNTQWRLLLPLLEEMAAGGERARSAFIVGDIKQSIYGFRRANPELMPLAEHWLAQRLGGVRAQLSDSRRSAAAVIRFVNAVFAQPEAVARLPDFPEHGTHRRDDWGRVEVAPLIEGGDEEAAKDPPFRNPLTTPRNDPENTRALREGRLIAARIRSLVQSGWDAGGRALGYGDVMILLRRRTHQQAIETALGELDIPFTGAARGTLLDTVEAMDMTALLRWLNSPARDLDLAHALRSPLFGASDGDLAALAAHARAQQSTWLAALLTGAAPALERARTLLPQWLDAARRLPAHDLLDRIYTEGNAAARYESALPPVPAARVRANLDAYIQLALEADSGRYPSLSKFLRHLQQAAMGDAPDEAPPPAAGGQVRIMTIHAAKGLEAPAVFLAQAASPGRDSGAGWLVDWPHGEDAPSGFVLGGRAGERDGYTQALIDGRAEREAREDMNLLYVAVTRARQFLHVSGFAALRPSKKTSWHALAQAALGALAPQTDEDGTLTLAEGSPPKAGAPSSVPAGAPIDPRLSRPLAPARNAQRAPSAADGDLDPAGLRRGTAIHFLLQRLADEPGIAESRLRAQLQARTDCTPAEWDAWLAEARRVAAAPELARFFDRAKIRRAWNEVPLHDGEIAGVIDRLVDDGETLWVLDYKTHREAADAALLDDYRRQLSLYREGVRRLWPQRTVRAGLVLTAAARWLELAP